MVKGRIPSRNEKRFNTLYKKKINPTLKSPSSVARSQKLNEFYLQKEAIVKKGRRLAGMASMDKEHNLAKSAKVTLRNIRKVEAKRMRKLRKDLPMILQRGANLHNENNLAFVNNILSNLI